MTKIFQESFLKNFWDESDHTYRDYTGPAITKEQIQQAEETLGYKMPHSYIELLENKNGGVPKNTRFPTTKKTCWAKDHVAISGIHGINDHDYSLLGGLGSQFMQEEWGYPNIGIVICDCPSAGDNVVMLDYRKCKKGGEPTVVHVDVIGSKPKITPLAENFETFVRGLVNESVYAPPVDEKLKEALDKVTKGSFSPVLLKAFEKVRDKMPDADQKLRRLGNEIVKVKQGFHPHGDDLSYLLYDYLFWLFCHVRYPKSKEDYLEKADKLQPASYDAPYYALMISLSVDKERYGFCTGAYVMSFIQRWWDDRLKKGELVETAEGFTFSSEAEKRVFAALANLEEGIVPNGKHVPGL